MEMWDIWCTDIQIKRVNIFLKYRPKNLTRERDAAFEEAFYKSENYEDFCNRLSVIYKDGEEYPSEEDFNFIREHKNDN